MARTRSNPVPRPSRQLRAQLRKHNRQRSNLLRGKHRGDRRRKLKLRDSRPKGLPHKASKPPLLSPPNHSHRCRLHNRRHHRRRKMPRLRAQPLRPLHHRPPKTHRDKAAQHRHLRPHRPHPSPNNRHSLRHSSRRPRMLPSHGFGLTVPSVSEQRRAKRRSRSTPGKFRPSCARAQLSA